MGIIGNVLDFWSGIFTPSDGRLQEQIKNLDSVQCIEVFKNASANIPPQGYSDDAWLQLVF